VLGLLANEYLPFSLPDVIVPRLAVYRPLVTALGVVAMELFAALALTNRCRKSGCPTGSGGARTT
jgi:hypothetical protein